MKGLIQLLIVAALGYAAYTYFVAGASDVSDEDSGAGESPALCIDRLGSALDDFGSVARDFGVPPVDVDAWSDRHERLRESVDRAEVACECGGEACRRGLDAARPLADLIADFDDGIVGGSGPPPNAATRLDRIQRAYDDARALAR